MLGEAALNLVKEAGRNKENLNPFNEDLVRQSIEETRRLWEQNRYMMDAYLLHFIFLLYFYHSKIDMNLKRALLHCIVFI